MRYLTALVITTSQSLKRITTALYKICIDNNLVKMKCNNKSSTQQSIRYIGGKNWNDLPEKAKTKFLLAYTLFWFHTKKFLTETQI